MEKYLRTLIKRCLVGLVFVVPFLNSASYSQAVLLPAGPAEFIKAMNARAKASGKDTAVSVMNVFTPMWNSDKISADEKNIFIAFTNKMVSKNFPFYPHLATFSLIVMNFKNGRAPASIDLNRMFSILDSTISKLPSRDAGDFLGFVENYTRTGRFYDNVFNGAHWYPSGGTANFYYDNEPVISVQNVTMKYVLPKDSIIITNTNGNFYPLRQMFYGYKGTMTWERMGVLASEIYCELDSFSVPMKETVLKAESVTFYYKSAIAKPLKGSFEDRISNIQIKPEDSQYPFFKSYDAVVEFKDLLGYYIYKGGFTLRGLNKFGSGTSESEATVTFIKRKEFPVVIRTNSLHITPSKLDADVASVTIHLGKSDSIYHPAVNFSYDINKRKLSLWRNPKSSDKRTRAPFINSYQNYYMDFEAVYWYLDSTKFILTNIVDQMHNPAVMESADYFNATVFKRLKGIMNANPVTMVNNYKEENPDRNVLLADLAKYMSADLKTVELAVQDLSAQGYLTYNSTTSEIGLLPRGKQVVESARRKKDYDSMAIPSTLGGGYNAEFNIQNFELKMKGITKFYLGDSVSVAVIPKGTELTFLKDRNFRFAGKMEAGKADFYGGRFTFDYKNYSVVLEEVDSMQFYIPSKENAKKYILLQQTLRNVKGFVYVEKPDNKNSRKRNYDFPKLEVTADAQVLWEYPHIRKSAYKKEKFFFTVYPFSMDSLDDYRSDNIRFPGMFVSSIFPDFKETLVIQEDLSLGFNRTFLAEGSSVYDNRGRYYNFIKLDNSGLMGKGRIEYLASNSESEDFVFYPDSVNSLIETFNNKSGIYKGVSYPAVSGENLDFHWLARHDSMLVTDTKTEISLYDGFMTLHGTGLLTPIEFKTIGRLSLMNAEIASNNTILTEQKFTADNSRFRLKQEAGKPDYFKSYYIRLDYDVANKTGTFKKVSSASAYSEFPFNQYKTMLTDGTWNTAKGEITLASGAPMGTESYYFQSTNAAQDSLKYMGTNCVFTSSDSRLAIDGVPYIYVADAQIFPDQNKVAVKPLASMETLRKATITANTETAYHKFYDAIINIKGKFDYSGSALLDYMDVLKQKQQLLYNTIKVKREKTTEAVSAITEDLKFTLMPRIQFAGTATITAAEKFQRFAGKIRVLLEAGKTTDWMKYDAVVNPDSNFIVLRNQVNENGFPLTVGTHLDINFQSLYTNFIQTKKRGADLDLITTEGMLTYNQQDKEFQIGEKNRLMGNTRIGNMFRYSDIKHTASIEGSIVLPIKTFDVVMQSAGQINTNYVSGAISMNIMLGMDIPIPSEIWKFLFDKFSKAADANKTLNYTSEAFLNEMAQFLGDKKTEKYIENTKYILTAADANAGIDNDLLLSDLKLQWNDTLKTLHCQTPVVLMNVGKQPVNKYINCYMEIQTNKTADTLKMYFSVDNNNWFYLSYANNICYVISSYDDLNSVCREQGTDRKLIGISKDFLLIAALPEEKDKFIQDFELRYKGIRK